MKALRLTLIFLCFLSALKAQKIDLTGSVTDTLNDPLIGATVMLLTKKDSVLTKFGITNHKGQFKLEKISPDDYILQMTYLGFTNLSQPFSLVNQVENKDLGVFQLLPETALLEQVEVKAEHIPIQMRHDTLEYSAAAFQTKPNAVVEDLLRKLPGVEVDRNGGIKAQGKNVQKVLVDGKEFFGNDPKIATKNLPADAVDKVQVFDKKSDIAEFSGIDDGRAAKTINLSLKEDKKKGYFGRVKGGYGNDERYENKFNVNRFGSTVQLSALGMFNNTNQQGFSFNDYINMMGGLNNLLSGGNGQISLNSDDLGLPLDAGQKNHGFNKTSAGGINLNWELGAKTELHASYFFNGVNQQFDIMEQQENLIDNQSFTVKRTEESNRKNEGHRLNLTLTTKIDSFQTLKWRTNLGITNKTRGRESLSLTNNFDNVLENRSLQNSAMLGRDFQWNNNLTYLRRFRKKGRFFTARLALENQNRDGETELTAINEFLNNPIPIDSLNQIHFNRGQQTNYGAEITYTEPIGKKMYLEFNYAFQNYSDEVDKKVYDEIENNRILNIDLSNQFESDYLYHKGGLNYKWTFKKFRVNAGLQGQNATLKGLVFTNNFKLNKDFFNFLPKVHLNYDFKATRSLRFNYRTSIRAPYLEQLQPIINNNDPLNIYVGNPNLIPEYLHDLELNFNAFDQFSSISIFASLNATIINDKILNSRTLDSQFKQTIQPVNFGSESRYSTYLSFGVPLKFIKSRVNLITDLDWHNGNYFINGSGGVFEGLRKRFDITLSNKNAEIVDLAIGFKWTDNQVDYTNELQQNQAFQEQIFYTDLSWNISDAWTISSSFDYTNYSNASFANATKIAIWQAAIDFNFLKNKRGTLQFSANDLLNQNIGINRVNQLNFVQEQRIASLGRYFLLSFSYRLSAFGGNESGIEVVKRR